MSGTMVIKRIALAIGVIVIALVTLGATVEQVVRHKTANRFPVAGRLVDLGNGRRLQVDCRGSGSPTVVLESGLDYFGSLSWIAVHDSIASTTRVCAYSRPGIMWSDPIPGAFSARDLAHDLHTALVNAGERGPWVLVGHSMGGPYSMAFTRLYDKEVAGLVLLDTSHPDQFAEFEKVVGKPIAPTSTVPWIGARLAWTGLLRLVAQPHPPNWPRAIDSVASQFLPLSLGAIAREVDAVNATLDDARSSHALRDRPLSVLGAGLVDSAGKVALQLTTTQAQAIHAVSLALKADQAGWSSRGRHEVVPGASHYIQFDRPDVVIRAVRDVVREVREVDLQKQPPRSRP